MKHKLFIVVFFILAFSFNPIFQSNASSNDFREKRWFSFIDEQSSLVGTGKLSFFGIKLYRASLFSGSLFNPEFPFKINFALEIEYAKKFSKEKIANISRKEMLKLNIYKEKDLLLWHKWMLEKFPDISKNDTLTGIFSPNFGLKIFHNNKLIASNSNVEFAKAFFSIWLNKNTSEPTLRRKLLGLSN